MRTWLRRHVFVHIAIEFMPFPRLSHAVPRHEYTRPEAPRPEDPRPEGSNISGGEELFRETFMRATQSPMNRRNRGAIHLRRPATRTRQKFERREAERQGTLRREFVGREGVRLEFVGARHDAENTYGTACVMQRKEKHARCTCMCIAERALDVMLVAKPKASEIFIFFSFYLSCYVYACT